MKKECPTRPSGRPPLLQTPPRSDGCPQESQITLRLRRLYSLSAPLVLWAPCRGRHTTGWVTSHCCSTVSNVAPDALCMVFYEGFTMSSSSSSSWNSVRVTFLMAISWWRIKPQDDLRDYSYKEEKWKLREAQRKSDLSVGADEAGCQKVAGAPGVLALPHQVTGRVVGGIARCSPDLQRSKVRV